jgi:hypothetical protein
MHPLAVHQTKLHIHVINTMLRNSFKKEFLETSLLNTSLPTLKVKFVATYLKQSGLVHHLKTTVHQEYE